MFDNLIISNVRLLVNHEIENSHPFYKQALLFQNDSLHLYLIWIRSILQSIIHIYCISDMMFDIILSPIFPAGFLS